VDGRGRKIMNDMVMRKRELPVHGSNKEKNVMQSNNHMRLSILYSSTSK
jgi:hypothetical protein